MATITFSTEASDEELTLIMSFIAQLRGDQLPAPAPYYAPNVSDKALGEVSAPSTSVTGPVASAVPDAPSASAPVVAPPPPLASPLVVLDAEGLPWDARIHGERKSQTDRGIWKRKRNTDDDLWESVRAELKRAQAAPAPAPVVAPLPPAATVVPPPPVVDVPNAAEAFAQPVVPMASLEPVAIAAVEPPTPHVPTPAPTGNPLGDLLVKITAAQAAGVISVEQVTKVARSLGLTGIRDLVNRPDLIPSFETLALDQVDG